MTCSRRSCARKAAPARCWISDLVTRSGFAAYFLASAWLVTRLAPLAVAILNLWAWQFLWLPQTSLIRIFGKIPSAEQAGSVGLTVAGIAVAFTALTSAALWLRYRKVDSWPLTARIAALHVGLVASVVLLVLLAAGVYTLTPVFTELYTPLGPDLPFPTAFLLAHYRYVLLVPLLAAVAALASARSAVKSGKGLRTGLNVATGLLLAANLSIAPFLTVVVLPFQPLGRCV